MDQISQHFCTQDKARQSVWTRIQSYGISLRTFERSSRVHYLSTITIYILVSLHHFLPLFVLLTDWKAQKFLKGLQCENVKTFARLLTWAVLHALPNTSKFYKCGKLFINAKMFLATEMLRNYNTNATIMTLKKITFLTHLTYFGK